MSRVLVSTSVPILWLTRGYPRGQNTWTPTMVPFCKTKKNGKHQTREILGQHAGGNPRHCASGHCCRRRGCQVRLPQGQYSGATLPCNPLCALCLAQHVQRSSFLLGMQRSSFLLGIGLHRSPRDTKRLSEGRFDRIGGCGRGNYLLGPSPH